MIKTAIFTTHPIQYYAPWFRMLAKQKEIDLTVYYGFFPDENVQGEEFDLPFEWDIPLLDGYHWRLLKKQSDSGNGRRTLYNTKRLNRIFLNNKPDVAIITGWHTLMLWQVLFYCKWYQTPAIVRGDSNALRKRPRYLQILHRFLFANFNLFLSVGIANRDFYLQNGVKHQQIFKCFHCIDNQRFLSQLKQLNLPRNQLDAQDTVCFLFVGKLIEKKRIMDLLNAFKLAQKKKRKIKLMIVGAGKLMGKARYYTTQYGLPVTFTGFLNQTEIISAYASSDCLVLPSDFGETWGLVVNEAMVCGLPAIVSDRVGCGPDLVRDNETGFIFPFGNINALAQKMIFMACQKRCHDMGAYARQHVLKHYSIEKAVQGTLEAVRMVSELEKNNLPKAGRVSKA